MMTSWKYLHFQDHTHLGSITLIQNGTRIKWGWCLHPHTWRWKTPARNTPFDMSHSKKWLGWCMPIFDNKYNRVSRSLQPERGLPPDVDDNMGYFLFYLLFATNHRPILPKYSFLPCSFGHPPPCQRCHHNRQFLPPTYGGHQYLLQN